MSNDSATLVDREPEEKLLRIDRHEVSPRNCKPAVFPQKLRRLLNWVLGLSVASCTMLAICFFFRAPLLGSLAAAWVVNEPVDKADAIVILGGGLENRPFAAAKLYKDGVAPIILCMNVRLSPSEELGLIPSEGQQTRNILLKKGVPEAAIKMIGTNVANTFDESRAVRAWIQESGAKSIVIATDDFHTRRARWIFRKELKGTSAEIHVVGIPPIRYEMKDWWKKEEGLIALQNEVVKYAYYQLKY